MPAILFDKGKAPRLAVVGRWRLAPIEHPHLEAAGAPVGIVEPLALHPTGVAGHVELDDEHAWCTALVRH